MPLLPPNASPSVVGRRRRGVPRPAPAALARRLAASLALAATLVVTLTPAARAVDATHDHTTTPLPPLTGDARFMPGTVGPVVFRGTAATVTIPDGTGFGGERGRRQNAGDLRKNNYSVTDANFSNVLGLLPRNPDDGTPLTYVEHIQLYAAAGFIETFAPAAYATLVAHQNAGHGTVLGAAGYLMGLVHAYDPAAQGIAASQIPATLPGTSMSSRNYVRSTRDATGQEWARPHHAQTAPQVFAMLTEAGLSPSIALILASDDGISGAGRLNGVNEQDQRDGFNDGERATWAFAAQVQAQTGIPVVAHLMHGHDHAGIDASALTRPRINALIGLAADDRSTSDARAAAIAAALANGVVATAATAAADDDLVVRNEAYLRTTGSVHVYVDTPYDWHQDVGNTRDAIVIVKNEGPFFAEDVAVSFDLSPNARIVAIEAPDGVHCMLEQRVCHVGDLSGETNRERRITVKLRFASVGMASFDSRLTTATPNEGGDAVLQHRENGVHARSTASIGMASRTSGLRASSCGKTTRTACAVRKDGRWAVIASTRPSAYVGKDRRWIKVVFEQQVGRRWVQRSDHWGQVGANGFVRLEQEEWRFKTRGVYRMRVEAGDHHLLLGTTSGYRYLRVR